MSNISVELAGGLTETLDLIIKLVIPWRKKHAETLNRLQVMEKQVEIEAARAEVLERQALAQQELDKVHQLRQKTERLQLENEKLRLELQRSRINLALELLERIKPDLPEEDKTKYVAQLLEPLRVLTESSQVITDSSNDPESAG